MSCVLHKGVRRFDLQRLLGPTPYQVIFQVFVSVADNQAVETSTLKKGYTLVQLLETSNITAHFVEETNDMYLDVFSCKSFDKRVAFKVIIDFFHPKKICSSFIKRQA